MKTLQNIKQNEISMRGLRTYIKNSPLISFVDHIFKTF